MRTRQYQQLVFLSNETLSLHIVLLYFHDIRYPVYGFVSFIEDE